MFINKIKKKAGGILLALLVALLFMLPTSNAQAKGVEVQKQSIDSVIDAAKPISTTKLNGDGADKLQSSKSINQISTNTLPAKQQKELKELGLEVNKVEKVEILQDIINNSGKSYSKYIIDDQHYICLDENKNILSIYNTDDKNVAASNDAKWATTEKNYKQTGEKAFKMLNLDKSYKLVASEENDVDYWFLAYRKELSNGLINESQGFNITIARADNSVAFLHTFNMPANTLEAKITKEEALKKAQPIIEKIDGQVNDVELKYVQPNYFWQNIEKNQADKADKEYEIANFVRLAYQIKLNDNNYFIDVDALTGEIIGGDETLAIGGSYADPYVGSTHLNNLAANAFYRLGYSAVSTQCNSNASMKRDILNFLKRSDAYAFNFYGHGSQETITTKMGKEGLTIWRIYSSEVPSGSWRFVFLSGCLTAQNDHWANTFGIYSSSSNKAYLGWANKVVIVNARQFGERFWPGIGVGSGSIRNQATYARDSLSGLDLQIRFVGDRNYTGRL